MERLTAIFHEVWRVLRDDGTLWLNLGDSYTSGNRATRAPDKKNPVRAMSYRARTPKGMKPKDLVGIPWMVAFALRDAGWYFRSDVIWEKPNCMPESVKDRPTRSHEYMFLFTKSLRYHYDASKARVNGRNRRTVWSVHPPLPVLQISFYQSLERLRPTHLLDALLRASSEADIHKVDRELRQFADTAALQRLAGWGLRGEIVFAALLSHRPG